MFEPKCPGCNSKADFNSHYKCPNCGYKFWNSRAAYLKNKKLNFKSVENFKKVSITTKKSNPIINSIVLFIAALFVSAFIIMILYGVIGELTGAIDKCDNLDSSQTPYCRLSSYHWLISSFVLTIIIFFGFKNLSEKRENNSDARKSKKPSKIICPKCGKKIDNDSKYCIYCGSKI